MSVVNGYSPEQAFLGRSSRIPGSICSDETTIAYSLEEGEDTQSDLFNHKMQVRTEARKAMIEADNSQAIRRAILRQSRGREHDWHCGELCMVWGKRRAPNKLEKGRWVEPCQVIMNEKKNHRLGHTHELFVESCKRNHAIRVPARVSKHHVFNQIGDQRKLQAMAEQLQVQLKEKSGMLQFSDQVDNTEYTHREAEPSIGSPSIAPTERSLQPEEEPHRRMSGTGSHISLPPGLGLDASQVPIIDPNAEEELGREPGNEEHDPVGPDNEPNPSESNGESLVVNACVVEGESQEGVSDRGTLWSDESLERAEAQFCSFDFVAPVKTLEKFCKNPCFHAEALNRAAKKTHTEVHYRQLTKQEQQEFDQAKKKELKCWIETNTVEPLLRNKIHPTRIMTSKWVLTWKEDHTSPTGRKPKARLLIRVFQDPDVGVVSTESPTLSRDGRMMIFQAVSSLKWELQSFDIKLRFLRGRADERQLAIYPVPEFQELLNLSEEHVLLLKGNGYGRVDAPLLFYKAFRKCLGAEGFEAHPLDNCLFLEKNQKKPSTPRWHFRYTSTMESAGVTKGSIKLLNKCSGNYRLATGNFVSSSSLDLTLSSGKIIR